MNYLFYKFLAQGDNMLSMTVNFSGEVNNPYENRAGVQAIAGALQKYMTVLVFLECLLLLEMYSTTKSLHQTGVGTFPSRKDY